MWVGRNREWLGHPNLLRRPNIAFSSSEYLVGLFIIESHIKRTNNFRLAWRIFFIEEE
jgi:hypothetical protein